MQSKHLRVYYGPQDEAANVNPHEDQHHKTANVKTVNVSLEEVLPLLADAYRSDRTWLRDFAGDEITISMDLYEVLLAYRHYRRPVA